MQRLLTWWQDWRFEQKDAKLRRLTSDRWRLRRPESSLAFRMRMQAKSRTSIRVEEKQQADDEGMLLPYPEMEA
jgi:hypothetical protein